MNSIVNQIKDIKASYKAVESIVENYKMGMLTFAEFWGQINEVEQRNENTKVEIATEHTISMRAVNLMLEL
jgi:hypothetical protein